MVNHTMAVDPQRVSRSLEVIKIIANKYKNVDNIVAIEVLNEPLYDTPIDALKDFYWDAYNIIRSTAPSWIVIFHDSFRLNLDTWGGFLDNCPNFAIDSHMYLAWQEDSPLERYCNGACNRVFEIISLESKNIPVIVGEWSLATDNCAMWLQGFNNNIYGYPKKECKYVPCPDPYMGPDQPGAPPDPSKGMQDPYGLGNYILY